jgi:cyanuric acid amidohydrolase
VARCDTRLDRYWVIGAGGSASQRYPIRAAQNRLVNIFAKAEASPDASVRGFRHTMLDDTDISATRHARAAVGGLISGLAGTGAVYVSGGAEHQGPPGGGPVAAIARQ